MAYVSLSARRTPLNFLLCPIPSTNRHPLPGGESAALPPKSQDHSVPAPPKTAPSPKAARSWCSKDGVATPAWADPLSPSRSIRGQFFVQPVGFGKTRDQTISKMRQSEKEQSLHLQAISFPQASSQAKNVTPPHPQHTPEAPSPQLIGLTRLEWHLKYKVARGTASPTPPHPSNHRIWGQSIQPGQWQS